jgi:putative spermidine/putrescine transport system substrate-binding protein
MTLRFAVAVGLAAAGLASAAVLPQAGLGAPAGLTIAVAAGALAQAIDTAFATPFAQAGGSIVAVIGTDGSVAAARAAHADVAVIDAAALAAGCKSGALQKLDWNALGGRARQISGAASDCGEGAVLRSLVLAWNRDKFPGQPSWVEFWDVAKVPGKRGLRRGARGNLELALLADGVAAGDVYSTLRSDAGVQRAFRKLDQLKPYLVWWAADPDAAKLLQSGEVLMTSAPAETIYAAQRGANGAAYPAFAVQWADSLTCIDSFAIPAGDPNAAQALKFLAFAADPKNQRRLPPLGGYGGTSDGATDGLPAAQQEDAPSLPGHLAESLAIDESFWQDNGPKLEKLYESWLAK